ncbi:MAG: DUF1028 domain-containing protein [Actinomycetota bacterium]
MTFSIVAVDTEAGELGVAVASKFPAVGVVVPWAQAGAGAVATQSYANTSYGPAGLELMAGGRSAQEALNAVVTDDDGRSQRQVGMADARGGAATFTGEECLDWAGGRTGAGYACQGNILVGDQVVADMAAAFEGTDGDLIDRLVAAIVAGDRAGGDRRGRQSAALVVVRTGGGYGGYTDRYVDLRVDDHPDAPTELVRVFEAYDREILIRDDPELPATPELVSEIQRRLSALGRYEGETEGAYDPATRQAIADFAGELNLEGKIRDDDVIFESIVREVRDITPQVT